MGVWAAWRGQGDSRQVPGFGTLAWRPVEEAWCFAIGLAFYPGYNARSATVADRCWMPLMPVANNGTFLADTSRTY